ncbi:MAG: hypothetical protein ACLUFU_01015 [Bacilli bacterium]
MREVSGSTWVFQMMILFILIFACFLALILNYNKAYRVKNNMISIIETSEGITEKSLGLINNVLRGEGYNNTGYCPVNDGNWYGATDLTGNYEEAKDKTRYLFCFKRFKTSENDVYYEIKVFYEFTLPFLGPIGIFPISGRTDNFFGSREQLDI